MVSREKLAPQLHAVAIAVVCGEECAIITETRTSRKSVKIAGQDAIPMETQEDFDGSDEATIGRACVEEIRLAPEDVRRQVFLNRVETRPTVELRGYALEVDSKSVVGRGEFEDEVSPVKWVPLSEIIGAKGSLRFRPGTIETVIDYLRFRQNPESFTTGDHLHTELVDQIPEVVYHFVEAGFSGKEAVSQWRTLQQIAQALVVLDRSQYRPQPPVIDS